MPHVDHVTLADLTDEKHPDGIKLLTLLTPDRIERIRECLHEVERRGIEGDSVEIGVYKGGISYLTAHLLSGRTHYAIDPFGGLPRFEQNTAEIQAVREYLSEKGNIEIIEGDFMNLSPIDYDHLSRLTYAFVHLDCDLFAPTRFALYFFGHRLSVGGFIVVDDYGTNPEINKAVGEFLEKEGQGYEVDDQTEMQLILRRKEEDV